MTVRDILSTPAPRGGQRSCSDRRAALELRGSPYLPQESFSGVKSRFHRGLNPAFYGCKDGQPAARRVSWTPCLFVCHSVSLLSPQWEEVSGYDDSMSPIRTYQVCNVRQPSQNNWLRTDFIPRKGVLRVYVELKFSHPKHPRLLQGDLQPVLLRVRGDAATDSSPLWRENPYVKVDTIAPDESFSLLEAGRINTKVRSFGPLSRAGFYLAFQDLGACMSLISVRVFFKKCSTTIANFAVFPETATGAEATSLVIAPGACVNNAMEVCTATGTETCIPGTFKSKFGEGSCTPCPSNSRTSARGANICPCQSGFYRADSDPPDSACTTIPKAPRNVISSVNETSLSLEWEEPEDTGGRSDLVYNVGPQPLHALRRQRGHRPPPAGAEAEEGGASRCRLSTGSLGRTPSHPAHRPSDALHLGHSQPFVAAPEKPNGVILDYEIKYHERGQAMSHTVTSQHSSAKVEGLRAGSPYVVQVRARTVAGYGRYSNPMDFSTSLHSDPQKSVQDQLPLIVGSASAGLVVIVALVVIAVVCLKKQRSGSELEYTEKLQQYISPGVKVYIDPFTYEDPNDAIHEFAKEIDISCVKIEEVIGAAGKGLRFMNHLSEQECAIEPRESSLGEELGFKECMRAADTIRKTPKFLVRPLSPSTAPRMFYSLFKHPEAFTCRLIEIKCTIYRLETSMPEPLPASHPLLSVSCPTNNTKSPRPVLSSPPLPPLSHSSDSDQQPYRLMLECWMKERNLRPKFSRIVSTLDKLLRNAASLKVGPAAARRHSAGTQQEESGQQSGNRSATDEPNSPHPSVICCEKKTENYLKLYPEEPD
ncbi:hypothetical protein F7725_011923, partial [Dissostichus mawsoni]